MRTIITYTLLFLGIAFFQMTYAQVSVTASLGTPSGNYTTVKGAFDKINDGTHKGSIQISIGNTPNQVITETAEAALNKSGTGAASYSAILITPGSTNITVTSSIAGACCVASGTIKLNLAQNVTVDGRQNASGGTIDLTISNSSTSTWSAAFVFFAASSNTLRYCSVKSSGTGTSGGVGTISIMDNNVVGGSGSSNNIVEYCQITKQGSNLQRRGIALKGASTRENTGNIIRNNTIFDFVEYGIFLGNSTSSEGFNRSTVIENNIIYQPNAFVSMSANQIAICVGNPFSTTAPELGTTIIQGNSIGGNGAGGKWTCTTTSSSYRIAGIAVNSITTATTSILNNVITDFNLNMTNTASDYSFFSGITVSNGKVWIQSNQIGKSSDVSSINLSRNNATAGGFVSGIHVNSTSTLSNRIIKNTVTGISVNTGASNFINVYGINNTCSSTNPTDSIYKNNVSYLLVSKANYLTGINGKGLIAKNRVRDLDFTGAATLSELRGIVWNGGNVSGSDARGVENNEVILGRNQNGTSVAGNDLIIGINLTRGDAKAYHNSVVIEGDHTGSDNTIALLVAWSGSIEVANNALYNERAGGTGKHYAISRTGTGVSYLANNNAYVIGTGANNLMGLLATTDKATLAAWTASPISETASLFESNTNQPLITLFPLISQDSLDITTTSWLIAGASSFVSDDIRDMARNSTPAIGAYEPTIVISALPVELLYFDGQTVNRWNKIEWATSSELNCAKFILERSTNCYDWEILEEVQGAGTTTQTQTYSVWDKDPFNLSYYRLIQVDFNQNMDFYGPIALKLQAVETGIQLYPNPASNYLQINWENTNKTLDYEVIIYTNSGQEVRRLIVSGKQIIDIRDLATGMYVVNVISGGQTTTHKLCITH